jgi:DNA-binding NtrC family response regulator
MADILIVEDSKEERERIYQLFTNEQYQVVACTSVAEAQQALARDSFSLAFLDIGLGDRSGSHLFSQLQQGSRSVKVIVYTGNPSLHLKQRFMQEGAVDYIVKGSSQAQSDQLLQRVHELIGAPQKRGMPGIPLAEFLQRAISESSRALFHEADGVVSACTECGARDYVVSFEQKPQVPPDLHGVVVCAICGAQMDPTVG